MRGQAAGFTPCSSDPEAVGFGVRGIVIFVSGKIYKGMRNQITRDRDILSVLPEITHGIFLDGIEKSTKFQGWCDI